MMAPLASTFVFVLAVVVLGFALRAVTRRKPSPPPVRTAEITTLRCGCDPGQHAQYGRRPIPCTDEEADWWFASESEGDCCVWQRQFNSRNEAEQALVERGWKSAQQWVRPPRATKETHDE
jgi:hypothetical protein